MQYQPPETSGTPLDPAVAAELRAMVASGELELPLPRAGDTGRRWAALAGWGRRDLALARLAEGHTDAVAILAEAGRSCVPGALYGVWAARPGGVGARLTRSDGGMLLEGTVRFCSGARILDRALVVADLAIGTATAQSGSGRLLLDVPLDQPGIVADPSSWATAAMASADTLDVRFVGVRIQEAAIVGGPDWYVGRPGFAVGGAGVAAVWWGGAAGVLDRTIGHLPVSPDAHQLAHLGELHAQVEAAHALLDRAAAEFDAEPLSDRALQVAELRCAVEHLVRQVLDRVPRMLGPGPLSRDGGLAGALADLGLYIRQHHGERDHAALGAQVFAAARPDA